MKCSERQVAYLDNRSRWSDLIHAASRPVGSSEGQSSGVFVRRARSIAIDVPRSWSRDHHRLVGVGWPRSACRGRHRICRTAERDEETGEQSRHHESLP